MKKTSFWLVSAFIFCMSSFVYAENATLGNDDILTISAIRAGNNYYKATLKKSSSELAPVFTLESVSLIDFNGGEHATYITNDKVLEVTNVVVGDKLYSITMEAEDASLKTFKVTNMNPSDQVSLLFMVSANQASFKESANYGGQEVGNHFVIDASSAIHLFSDRPHRIAKQFDGGLAGFAEFYATSDFLDDPPNVTFAGKNKDTGLEEATIFEMSTPFIFEDKFIMPVSSIIGEEVLPSFADYEVTSFVIDSWWKKLKHWAHHAAHAVEVVAAIVATGLTCTAVEVGTAGAATAACVAGVAATTALATK